MQQFSKEGNLRPMDNIIQPTRTNQEEKMNLRVPKERREVVIYTHNHRIEGEIYLLADSRLSDELNLKVKEFLPVTSARVYSITGDSLLYETDFVTVNKHSIDIVLTRPDETAI